MERPWQIWILFGLGLFVVLAGMAWISVTAIGLEAREAETRRTAALEENVRLALWRMDSFLAPLIAEESARPYFSYRPLYPVERAYTKMFGELSGGDILMPSELLVHNSPYVLLYFQFDPEGLLTSPQVPTGIQRTRVMDGRYLTKEKISASALRLEQLYKLVGKDALHGLLPQPSSDDALAMHRLPTVLPGDGPGTNAVKQRQVRNTKDWQLRYSQNAETTAQRQSPGNVLSLSGVKEGALKPVWIGTTLVLARRVSVNGKDYLQGAWLNWPAIKGKFCARIRDLLPGATLESVAPGAGEGHARMLASLPVRLVPGETTPVRTERGLSPIRVSLIIAWCCVLLGAAAVAALLKGTLALSERRGDFVSAVTHELRTPLTTFRMYSEMLAAGMVQDEQKRAHYINTLHTEAERLGHLVENVLAYARLERGRPARQLETVTVGALLEKVRERLATHAEKTGMKLVLDVSDNEARCSVQADAGAVEQVLFNLVDNACKYAASADDRRVHIETAKEGGAAHITVRDHGPGIAKKDVRRLFRPFSKSARQAAHSAPGVGLGLALSRRLARRMGGDLRLGEAPQGGALFILELPVL